MSGEVKRGSDLSRGGESMRLIRAYQAGEEEALDELFARYYGRVERIVRARTGPLLRRLGEIEDLVQETFLAAVKDFDRFELQSEAGLIQWLATIAERRIRNALQHHRAEKRDHRRVVPLAWRGSDSGSEFGLELAAETTGVASQAARLELARRVEEALGKLAVEQREVILLRHFAGGSWAFVAAERDLPSPGAARKLFARARVKLAKLLDP